MGQVRLGEHHLLQSNETKYELTVGVASYIEHEGYEPKQKYV